MICVQDIPTTEDRNMFALCYINFIETLIAHNWVESKAIVAALKAEFFSIYIFLNFSYSVVQGLLYHILHLLMCCTPHCCNSYRM